MMVLDVDSVHINILLYTRI